MLTNLSQDAARALWKWIPISFAASLVALSVASIDMKTADAKTPGSTYCFYGTCHRVKTLTEMQSLVGTRSLMQASFYDSCKVDPLNPCGLTSSGEAFHPDRTDNVASPIYPDGTKVLVWSAETKEAAVLRVNNAGPYWGPRTLDVSRAAAESLGFKPKGIGELEVRVLYAPAPHEATYRREREYEPVPGHLGQFESLDEADKAAKVVMSVQSITTAVLSPLAGYRPSPARKTPGLADPADGAAALVAGASGPATRTRLASVEPATETKAIVTAAVAPSKPLKTAKPLMLADTARTLKIRQPARVSEKHAKRTTVASRKASKTSTRMAARLAPRKSKAQVAVLHAPVCRVSSHDIITAGFGGPVTMSKTAASRKIAAVYGGQRKTLAKYTVASPVRQAAPSQGRSTKRLTGLQSKARLKVSDARDGLVRTMLPLTGDRLRVPVEYLNRDKALRPRGVPAGPMLALV